MKKDKNTPLRNRDVLVIKIVDWSDDKPNDEPAIDVEVYLNGDFDFEQSKVFSTKDIGKFRALELARHYALEFLFRGRLSLV